MQDPRQADYKEALAEKINADAAKSKLKRKKKK